MLAKEKLAPITFVKDIMAVFTNGYSANASGIFENVSLSFAGPLLIYVIPTYIKGFF